MAAVAPSAITLRLVWHAPQASSTAGERGASVRLAMPVCSFIAQVPRSVASSQATSPSLTSAGSGEPACFERAQAMWREPGPWQASQPTFTSENVVAYALAARSKFLATWVE